MNKFYEPCIGSNEINAVTDVLNSDNLVQGEMVKKFEKAIAKYVGTKYAVATSSGTTALLTTLISMGVCPGCEVIIPAFSFKATRNVVEFLGAIPIYADIDLKTFNMITDYKYLEKLITSDTVAIIPVHLYGNPVEMKKINELAIDHNLWVVTDACQAFSGRYGKKRIGSVRDAECFSFYPTKPMTTGEGGMITTNNKTITEKAKIIRNHGNDKIYGLNFRMTDIAAAIGLEQLKSVDDFHKQRLYNALLYETHLWNDLIKKPSFDGRHAMSVYTIRCKKRFEIVAQCNLHSIPYKIYYQEPFTKKAKNALKASKEVISLPIHPRLPTDYVQFVCNALKTVT